LNNVRLQDAHFQELVATYQNTVLKAAHEVENGLVTYIRAHNRNRDYTVAVTAEMAAFKEAFAQYKGGLVDYNRVGLIQERLGQRQQVEAAAQGRSARGLIRVYGGLGGGWQIRCAPAAAQGAPLLEKPPEAAAEPLPPPTEMKPMSKDEGKEE